MNYCECFPLDIKIALSKVNAKLQEIRIRNNCAVKVKSFNRWYYLTPDGMAQSVENAVKASDNCCFEILSIATNKSIYAFEQQLVQGFFTLSDGSRFGVCGKVESSDGKTVCFSSYSSMCIRVPRHIPNVAKEVYGKTDKASLLVAGKTGSGKTTFLRDYAVQLCEDNNVLVADERGELNCDGILQSKGIDVMSFASKKYCFLSGIRALAPDVIVTDELTAEDMKDVTLAKNAGVTVCASIHGDEYSVITSVLQQHNVSFDFLVILNHNAGEKLKLFDLNANHRII